MLEKFYSAGEFMFRLTNLKVCGIYLLTGITVILLGSTPAMSNDSCPALFAAHAENPTNLKVVKEIDFTRLPEYKQLLKDYPDLKAVAEYDQTGIMVVHASSLTLDGFHYYQSLLKHLPPDVPTLLVGSKNDYDSFVKYQFTHQTRKTEAGALDNFLEVRNETIPPGSQSPDARWIKDHLGHFVTYKGWNGDTVTGMVTSNYRYNYKISDQLAKYFGIPVVKNIPGQHEWGNFTVIGDTGYLVHGSRTHSDLRLQDFMYTGVKKITLLPQPELSGAKQGIPHVDEFLRPLSENHVATNIPEYLKYFEEQGKKVILLPNNGDLVLSSDIDLSHLNYANAVLVKGKEKSILFVPQFGKLKPDNNLFGGRVGQKMVNTLKKRDKEAIAAYKKLAEELNVTVVPVDVAQFTFNNFGGIHCATGTCGILQGAEKPPSWYDTGEIPL